MLHTHGARPHAKFRRRTSRRFGGDSKQTLRRLSILLYRSWADLGGGGQGGHAPQTPEVALCPMHYSLTVASYASLNPMSIQY